MTRLRGTRYIFLIFVLNTLGSLDSLRSTSDSFTYVDGNPPRSFLHKLPLEFGPDSYEARSSRLVSRSIVAHRGVPMFFAGVVDAGADSRQSSFYGKTQTPHLSSAASREGFFFESGDP